MNLHFSKFEFKEAQFKNLWQFTCINPIFYMAICEQVVTWKISLPFSIAYTRLWTSASVHFARKAVAANACSEMESNIQSFFSNNFLLLHIFLKTSPWFPPKKVWDFWIIDENDRNKFMILTRFV